MKALFVALVALVGGCDDRQVVHDLDPDLNRMMEQPRLEAYSETDAFRDGKSMQAPPPGAVPHEREPQGRPPLSRELLREGRRNFETVCATCHGIDGSGESVVATKMPLRKPPAFDDPRLVALSDEDLFRVSSVGYGFMPGYAFMLSPHERWAVVAYIHALRLSRRAAFSELPPEARQQLAKEAP